MLTHPHSVSYISSFYGFELGVYILNVTFIYHGLPIDVSVKRGPRGNNYAMDILLIAYSISQDQLRFARQHSCALAGRHPLLLKVLRENIVDPLWRCSRSQTIGSEMSDATTVSAIYKRRTLCSKCQLCLTASSQHSPRPPQSIKTHFFPLVDSRYYYKPPTAA